MIMTLWRGWRGTTRGIETVWPEKEEETEDRGDREAMRGDSFKAEGEVEKTKQKEFLNKYKGQNDCTKLAQHLIQSESPSSEQPGG